MNRIDEIDSTRTTSTLSSAQLSLPASPSHSQPHTPPAPSLISHLAVSHISHITVSHLSSSLHRLFLLISQATKRAITRQIKEVQKLVKISNDEGGFSM